MIETHRNRRRALLAALSVLLAASGARGEEQRATRLDRPHHRIEKATGPVTVDGRLDESAWGDALAIELDYEMFPGDNTPPAVRTEMLVTFDEDNLYAAFKAYDPEPQTIRARLADRDTITEEDFVGFTVDPFNDGRRGFEFYVNPLGVQADAVLDDLSRSRDYSWDTIWHSAGRIGNDGYVVELAIPFSSLRFQKIAGEQTWGVDGQRIYPRDQRYRYRTQRFDRNVSCSVCQLAKMTGIKDANPGRNLEIDPAVTGSRTDARGKLGDADLAEGDIESDFGLTLSWGVTPSLTLAATVNPDFSQVEADIPQLDVNTRFALFFPETRPFFNEGADFFISPLNVVHTRVLAEPAWGARATGKLGRHAIGFFSIQDELTQLVLPGSQRSASVQVGRDNLSTALRYRTDLSNRSSLGLLVTDREGEDDYLNRVAGVDGVFNVSRSDVVRFQLLGSQTRYSQAILDEGSRRGVTAPGGDLDDSALRLSYDHNSRNWNAYTRYEDVGEEFRADLGFMPRVDYRFVEAGMEHLWWGDARNWWTRIRAGGEWTLTENQSGLELERGYEGWSELIGTQQATLELGYVRRTRSFGGSFFEESARKLKFSIRPSGTLFFTLFAQSGDEIDTVGVRPGDELRFEPRLELNLGRHARAELRHTLRRLDVSGGELFEVNLTDLRLVYQINLRCFVRLITQYSDIARDPRLFANEVQSKEQDLLSQLLFSYKLNPRTVFFVGYSDNYAADDSIALTQKSRTLFMKVGYAWIP